MMRDGQASVSGGILAFIGSLVDMVASEGLKEIATDLWWAFVLGMVGACGGFVFNQIVKLIKNGKKQEEGD